MDFVRHIREDYAPHMRWRDVRLNDYDQTERTILADLDDPVARIIVTIKMAAYPNSGGYRHWATLHGNHYLSISKPRPEGRRYYTLMVGLLEDGEPWWSALWDEEVIAKYITKVERRSGPEGRPWYRCNPADFPGAIVMAHDFTKATLGLVPDVPAVEVKPTGKGKPWDDQKTNYSTEQVLGWVREEVMAIVPTWDSNSPAYHGRHNKTVKRHAKLLLGRPAQDINEAWAALVWAAFSDMEWKVGE